MKHNNTRQNEVKLCSDFKSCINRFPFTVPDFFFHFPCVSFVLSFSGWEGESGISKYSACSKWNYFCYCKPGHTKNEQRKLFRKMLSFKCLLPTVLSTNNVVWSEHTTNASWTALKMKELKVTSWVEVQFAINITQPLKTKNPTLVKYEVLQCLFKKEIALRSSIDAFHGHLCIVHIFQISSRKNIFKK